jgi:hypothetical protein
MNCSAVLDDLPTRLSQVGAEVVQHDPDPHAQRVQSPQVAQEGEELATALARLEVPIQLVPRQVVGRQQVPHAMRRVEVARRRRRGLGPPPPRVVHCRPGWRWRLSGPNSSTHMTTSGSPASSSAVPSMSPYRCRMRFLISKAGVA